MLHRLTALVFVACGSACTTVHSAYLSNLSHPEADTRGIEAEASKSVFLGFNFSNDYVFEARARLYDQCPDGAVTGVLSTYESTNYLLVVRHEVRVRGYCVAAPGGARVAVPTEQI